MDQKYFDVPFGTLGDKVIPPTAVDPSGAVSMSQGFGPDYERDLDSDPLAKPVPRDVTNGLFFALTQAMGALQEVGTPEWITTADNGGSPFPYEAGAEVRWRATEAVPFQTYRSLVGNNTTSPSNTTNWTRVDRVNRASLPPTQAGSGYFTLPLVMAGVLREIIVQFGSTVTASNGASTVTFPIPFPTTFLVAVASNVGQGLLAPAGYAATGSYSTTSMIVTAASSGGTSAPAGVSSSWIAIGY